MERHLLSFRQCLMLSTRLLLAQSVFFNCFHVRRGKEKKKQFPLSSQHDMGNVACVEMIGEMPRTKASGSDYVVNRSGDISRPLQKHMKLCHPGTAVDAGNPVAVLIQKTPLFVGIICKWMQSWYLHEPMQCRRHGCVLSPDLTPPRVKVGAEGCTHAYP